MTVILFDTPQSCIQLYPFSLVYPIAWVRHGLFTGLEWYEQMNPGKVFTLSAAYKYGTAIPENDDFYLCIDASVVPDRLFWEECLRLKSGEMLEDKGSILAYVSARKPEYGSLPLYLQEKSAHITIQRIEHPIDWVRTNEEKIMKDIATQHSHTETLTEDNGNRIFGKHAVYVAPGADVKGCMFNTDRGPVYIGKNALLMEGGLFRGPVAIGEGAVVKMGTQVYPGTTLGRKSIAGGEIKNSILGDYSNKAHHGYLGDSMVGRWCNLGAGTTNSNIKNNAGTITMWGAAQKDFIPVGAKAGMVMGDFSKTAINTSINTGTTIGCCTNIHQAGLPGKNIPSFFWGETEKYDFQKLKTDLQKWMELKQENLPEGLSDTLWYLYRNHP